MEVKRKHIRFQSDENTYLVIRLENQKIFSGLCCSESLGGCSGVFLKSDDFLAGTVCDIKVGKLNPMQAEIKWVSELDREVFKVGFEFLE